MSAVIAGERPDPLAWEDPLAKALAENTTLRWKLAAAEQDVERMRGLLRRALAALTSRRGMAA